jgi:hypothetical protein
MLWPTDRWYTRIVKRLWILDMLEIIYGGLRCQFTKVEDSLMKGHGLKYGNEQLWGHEHTYDETVQYIVSVYGMKIIQSKFVKRSWDIVSRHCEAWCKCSSRLSHPFEFLMWPELGNVYNHASWWWIGYSVALIYQLLIFYLLDFVCEDWSHFNRCHGKS